MKAKLFITAIVFVLVSCTNSKTSDTSSTAATNNAQDKNIENNNMIYKAIETGDMKPVDTLLTDDAVDHDGPRGTDIKGKDSILHMLGDLHNHFKDLKLDVIANAANSDYVFTLVHVSGTPTDSSMGMPGKAVDMNTVDVVKVKDGKMTEHWGFTDDVQVSKEMMEMSGKMKGMDKKK